MHLYFSYVEGLDRRVPNSGSKQLNKSLSSNAKQEARRLMLLPSIHEFWDLSSVLERSGDGRRVAVSQGRSRKFFTGNKSH